MNSLAAIKAWLPRRDSGFALILTTAHSEPWFFLALTSTAFVGDLANFVIGCSFILPASIIYSFGKKKKSAILGCIIGTAVLTVFGTAFNAIYLLPAFSALFGMPLESILEMGTVVNPFATGNSIANFVIVCVAPMNLIKGGFASIVTLVVYKKLSPIIKNNHH